MSMTLPIMPHNRRYRVGQEIGNIFDPKEEFDGLTLTIELKSKAEAEAVITAMIDQRRQFAP